MSSTDTVAYRRSQCPGRMQYPVYGAVIAMLAAIPATAVWAQSPDGTDAERVSEAVPAAEIPEDAATRSPADGSPLAPVDPGGMLPTTDPLAPVDAGGSLPATEPSAPVSRFELELELTDKLKAGDNAEAAALGDDLLTLAAAEFGNDSTAFADTLLLVAEAHRRNEDFQAAEARSLEAIEIYRSREGAFSESLIEPLVALGNIYHDAEDFLNAMPAYEEARGISRRVNGLLNEGQIEILDRISETAEQLGEITDAQAYQRDALRIVERRHEPHSAEVVAAVVRYGGWLREHGLVTQEQSLYARAERDVVDALGEDNIGLVPLLRARANSFRFQALNHPSGIGSLRRAMEILEQNPDSLMTAKVQRDIGDWEAAFDEQGTDGAEYLDAWNRLAEVENGDALREDWFGESPTRFVLLAARSMRGMSTDPDAALGQLIIRFTVLPSGLVADVEVSDADPPGIAEEAFSRQFRASRFRPMIRDGQLVASRRGFRAQFPYDPERDD